MDVYRQRERRERELRFLDQIRENRAAWAPLSKIADLGDPHGNRFLFEAPTKTPNWPRYLSDVT
jgi:hypothetical protein